MSTSYEIASLARKASRILATLSPSQRNVALTRLHELLLEEESSILRANEKDLASARESNLPTSLIARLDLSRPGKYAEMARGVLEVAALGELVGKCVAKTELDSGLVLRRVRCPLGVLLVIFEARPEVIVNITSLALKSGNAVILKGGRESRWTFSALSRLVGQALEASGIPLGAVSLVESREEVGELLRHEELIDLVIPRGSNELVKSIRQATRIPVMGHADGICHAYVDAHLSLQEIQRLVVPVILDAKTNYPAACNALEHVLLHESLRGTALPILLESLLAAGVTCRLSPELLDSLPAHQRDRVTASDESDRETEYLSLTLSIRSVDSIDSAVDQINQFGSHHTDTIFTSDPTSARHFQRAVDSASVFVNTSSRFADGMRYGFGTEVGIATGKIHARGPVGLEGIMTYKWLLDGTGQQVAEYGPTGKAYTHRTLPITDSDDC